MDPIEDFLLNFKGPAPLANLSAKAANQIFLSKYDLSDLFINLPNYLPVPNQTLFTSSNSPAPRCSAGADLTLTFAQERILYTAFAIVSSTIWLIGMGAFLDAYAPGALRVALKVVPTVIALRSVFFMLAMALVPQVDGVEVLQPARNWMEGVFWRFGDYTYVEFIGCIVVVLGVFGFLIAAALEDGGRELHLWINTKLNEIVGKIMDALTFVWEFTALERIGRPFIEYWTK